MKRFVFTRLFDKNLDYGLYVAPPFALGPCFDMICDDQLMPGKRYLSLYSTGTHIIFGTREYLEQKDAGGRPIKNFTGFILPSEGRLPSYAAFSSQFNAITEEAEKAHAILDKNPRAGDTLTESSICLDTDMLSQESDWDKAVQVIHQAAAQGKQALFVFDENGNQASSKHTMISPSVLYSDTEMDGKMDIQLLFTTSDTAPQDPKTFPDYYDQEGGSGAFSLPPSEDKDHEGDGLIDNFGMESRERPKRAGRNYNPRRSGYDDEGFFYKWIKIFTSWRKHLRTFF